jgi:hypothetical protein
MFGGKRSSLVRVKTPSEYPVSSKPDVFLCIHIETSSVVNFRMCGCNRYCRVRVKTPSEYQARCLEAELLALGAEVAKEKLPNYNGSPERPA